MFRYSTGGRPPKFGAASCQSAFKKSARLRNMLGTKSLVQARPALKVEVDGFRIRGLLGVSRLSIDQMRSQLTGLPSASSTWASATPQQLRQLGDVGGAGLSRGSQEAQSSAASCIF
jgi:hypothetical protein